MSAGVRVGVVLHVLEDQPWCLRLMQDLQGLLAHRADIHLEVSDGAADAERQLHLVEAHLAARVDVLMVLPIDSERLKPVLRGYREAGIPVIVLDNEVDDPSLYRSLIVADNRHFGRKMGEFFLEVTGGRAELLELQGIASTSAARDRGQGFREALAGQPGVRIVESVTGDWLAERAREQVAAALPRHPGLDGVYAQNDEMARGAWDAAAAAGRADELLITGIDALRGEHGLGLVMQGRLAATMINPSPAGAAAEALLAILRGEAPLKKTLLQTSLLRSNERVREWQRARRRSA
ncbi:MAG: substrate-binding domain-containing protein [Anaeromyxobacter sp.]